MGSSAQTVEDRMYEEALVHITWKLRQLKLFLHHFDATVDEAVNQNGVGTKRMEQMVNGDSGPMRKRVIADLRQTTPDLLPDKRDCSDQKD